MNTVVDTLEVLARLRGPAQRRSAATETPPPYAAPPDIAATVMAHGAQKESPAGEPCRRTVDQVVRRVWTAAAAIRRSGGEISFNREVENEG